MGADLGDKLQHWPSRQKANKEAESGQGREGEERRGVENRGARSDWKPQRQATLRYGKGNGGGDGRRSQRWEGLRGGHMAAAQMY